MQPRLPQQIKMHNRIYQSTFPKPKFNNYILRWVINSPSQMYAKISRQQNWQQLSSEQQRNSQ